jgi:hypothetical protein
MTQTLDQTREEAIHSPLLPTHDQVVCTLFEKDFHYGVAALLNSIVKGGFRGLIWAGYRGELPAWTRKLPKLPNGLFDLGGASLAFEQIATGIHFTQYKAEFLKTLLHKGVAKKYLWYFDPDITVRCSWAFFEQWVQCGVSLCQDITCGTMPSRHPVRYAWIDLVRSAGWGSPVTEQERYYNGGFIGLGVKGESFLTTWQEALDLAYANGIQPAVLREASREQMFHFPDQDALNIAAMYSDVPLSPIGPEGMGFIPGGFTMYHSVGLAKPWRKKFLRAALSGIPPTNGDKHYLESCDGPICAYTPSRLRRLRLQASIAAAMGRFYRRAG